MRFPLFLWGNRVTSWFRSFVTPTRTTKSEIYIDAERPWIDEQIATWPGYQTRRVTPIEESITGETVEMRAGYRMALAEPTVKAAVLGKIGNVGALNVQVVPDDKKNPIELECAQFVRSQLIGPSGTFHDIAWPILSGGLIDGWSVAEKQFGIIERGRWKNKWGLRGLKSKDTAYIQPEVDRYRNVTGLWTTYANAGKFFDPKDFIVFSYMSFFESPTGMSDIRAANRAVQMIVAAIKLRMIFLDKYTGPYLKGKYTDDSRRPKLREALKAARANGWIMLGPGDDVEVVDLASRGTSDFQAAIEDLRKEVAISIQGAFLTMLEGSAPGVRGNSGVQKETTEIFVELLVAQLMAVINTQLVPDLVIPNYGPEIAYPTVSLSAVDPTEVVAELAIDEAMQRLGLELSKEEVYDRAGRSPPKDPADVLAPQSQQQPGMIGGIGGNQGPFGPRAGLGGGPVGTFRGRGTPPDDPEDTDPDEPDWDVR